MYCKIGRQWRDRRNCVDGISYPCVSGCTPTLFRILQDTWSNEDVLQRTLPESITRSYLSQSPRLPFSFSSPLPLPPPSPSPTSNRVSSPNLSSRIRLSRVFLFKLEPSPPPSPPFQYPSRCLFQFLFQFHFCALDEGNFKMYYVHNLRLHLFVFITN